MYNFSTTSGKSSGKDVVKGIGGADKPKPITDGPYIKYGKPKGRPTLSGEKKLQFEKTVYNN